MRSAVRWEARFVPMITVGSARILFWIWNGKAGEGGAGGLAAGMEAVGLDVLGLESASEFEGCEVVGCFGLAVCDPWIVGFPVLEFISNF